MSDYDMYNFGALVDRECKRAKEEEQERIINIFRKYCKSPAVVFDDEGFLKEVKEDEK